MRKLFMRNVFKFFVNTGFSLALISTVGMTSPALAFEIRVVNMQELQEAPKLKSFFASLIAPIQKEGVELQLELEAFKTESNEFIKNETLLDPKTASRKKQTLEKKQKQLQEKATISQQKIEGTQQRVIQAIRKAVSKLRYQKGYDMILIDEVVLDTDPKLDVTKEVIGVLNTMSL